MNDRRQNINGYSWNHWRFDNIPPKSSLWTGEI